MRPFEHRLMNLLSDYVTDHKKRLIQEVLDTRTKYITVVLEDIYHPQNASAVIRSCDCFGIQELHIVENLHKYAVNPKVVHGASKWIDIIHYNEEKENTLAAIKKLKSDGYCIVGTSPEPTLDPVYDLDLSQKVALIFGTEKTGLTSVALDQADKLVTIPMYGFTESFNISVSAALCISTLMHKLHRSDIDWRLTAEERDRLKLDWFRQIVTRSDVIEKELSQQGNL